MDLKCEMWTPWNLNTVYVHKLNYWVSLYMTKHYYYDSYIEL